MARQILLAALLLALAACSKSNSTTDAGALTDASSTDGAVEMDAASADAGIVEADAGGPFDNDTPFAPDRYCPGPGCAETEGDDALRVGAAKVDITPIFTAQTDVQTVDTNHNGVYDAADGDQYADNNHNGVFDGIWMGGFDHGRAAAGVMDKEWVRSIMLERNGVRIALVSVDCVGMFRDDFEAARHELAKQNVHVDYVSVNSTHDHESEDTVGLWGPDLSHTGRSPEYNQRIRGAIVDSVKQSIAALEPAHITYSKFMLRDQPGGTIRFIGDARHPFIVDDEVDVMRFSRAGDETSTIATLINFGSHSEYTGPENQLLTSDYPGYLRDGVENGVTMGDGTVIPGIGGIAVFYQGALGVQIGPFATRVLDDDGTQFDEHSPRKAMILGRNFAALVLKSLGPDGGSVTDETATLGFRNRSFFVEVQNTLYQIAFQTLITTREAYFYDPSKVISRFVNQPWLKTEIAIIDIGRAEIIAVPGELDPSLAVGGYDGSYTPEGVTLLDPMATNGPDLSMAPGPPYLKDLARPGAEYVLFFGLAEDWLGYFVPAYDYKLDPTLPYVIQAQGSHYEEVNSLGPLAWPRIEMMLHNLLAWTPQSH